MLHELFVTHFTNGTLIMNPLTFTIIMHSGMFAQVSMASILRPIPAVFCPYSYNEFWHWSACNVDLQLKIFYYAYFVWCMCSRILVAAVMVLLHLLIIATNGLLSVLC